MIRRDRCWKLGWQPFVQVYLPLPKGFSTRDEMELGRRGVRKELDTEETPMFIASQGRCWMGCDLMCV